MLGFKILLLLAGVTIISAVRPRILGGKDADRSEFLFHVAILEINEDGTTHHVCGGAIIDRRFVLTAAHCVYDLETKNVMVRTGGNQPPPADKPHHETRVFRKAARIMYPKDYFKDERYHEYDIAVIKIQGTFDLADETSFKKVYLPNPDNDYEDKSAIVSGYGVHNSEQREWDADGSSFKALLTQVISTGECQASRTFILTRGSMCTQSIQMKGHTCYGDGGNPLVYDNQVIGILNNPSTCDSERPELFTKVSTYVDFIQKVMDGRYSSDVLYK